ncbi:unnamed protein product [Brassica napus]|uniref:(rape) hypothetical protein n=1 Tax=Brassica napus TaxID=3708 RepID=A0A816YRH9_BRANA|nr:unnamed protein product [Brassica napus]
MIIEKMRVNLSSINIKEREEKLAQILKDRLNSKTLKCSIRCGNVVTQSDIYIYIYRRKSLGRKIYTSVYSFVAECFRTKGHLIKSQVTAATG